MTTPTPSQASEEQPKKSEQYYLEDGDIEIMSSDQVLFKVHAYTLQASSKVFRDMIQNASSSVIELSDPNLEAADVLTSLLDNLTKGQSFIEEGTIHIVNVVRLAKKYAFDQVLALTIRDVRCHIYRWGDAYASTDNFVIGAELGDMEICSISLQTKRYTGSRYFQDGVPFGQSDICERGMDPAALDLEVFRLIKPEIMWAWLQAFRKSYSPTFESDGESEEEGKKRMRMAFRQIMSREGAPMTLS